MDGISEINISIISLGCPKALVDSEYMVSCLKSHGLSISEDYQKAQIIIINTCGFLKNAVNESDETIKKVIKLKKKGLCKKIIVAGCLVERYPEKLLKEYPEVDAVLGNSHFEDILTAVQEVNEGNRYQSLSRVERNRAYLEPLVKLTPKHYAYLKISEGCDHYCHFCVIPRIKGRYRSRPINEIHREAEALVENGVKEVILVAQDTTAYGKDIYRKNALAELLRKLSEIEKLKWIRVLYAYPSNVDLNLLKVMNEYPKICKYIDMPLQHADDKILQLMGRKGTKGEYEVLINQMREKVKGLILRTTFIVGYPGEKNEEFETLEKFVEKMKFERVGIFPYSREEGTKSYHLKSQVPEKVKRERVARLAIVQQKVSQEFTHGLIGEKIQTICDKRSDDEKNMIGRSYFDAPDIDGMVYIKDNLRKLKAGDMIKVHVTDATEYDLIGEIC